MPVSRPQTASARPAAWLPCLAAALGLLALPTGALAQVEEIQHAPGSTTIPGPEVPSDPDLDPDPDHEDEGGFFGGLSSAADWFFKREEGAEQHDRSWGFVPLVIADSTRGFGGGVALVEQDLFGLGMRGEVNATASSNGYYEPALIIDVPPFGPGIGIEFEAEYRSRPAERFYGLGNRARRRDESSMYVEQTRVELRMGGEFADSTHLPEGTPLPMLIPLEPTFSLFGVARFQNVNVRDGKDNDVPTIEEQFDVTQLVGYGSAGLTSALGISFVADGRDNKFNPTFGYRLELTALYSGKGIGNAPFRYSRFLADVGAFLPIYEDELILAAHLRGEITEGSRDRIPFYELPSLGGAQTLRGFLGGRYRDRHLVLGQVEVRFPVWGVLRGALFLDAGRVYGDIVDEAPDKPYLRSFAINGGFGLRFVLHPDILVRLDVGISRDEANFWLSFGYPF